ncbi:PilZ domain-containing protein [Herminiimonas arsenitoxidans]|uniref:PilZ domain-containing protein n=1 Tax=Herminiimonas arsenitoxidans TaxID=1809410 RepID=UPI0012FF72A8|nr:PilZ domain-containing protein [Herminiimonas arsenitoxidans]
MATHDLTLLPHTPRYADRKIFRRRAILDMGRNRYSHARTIDISPHALSIMVESPLSIGHTGSIAFNITVDQKTMPLEFKGKVSYCVLVGTEGFRVGFELASRGDAGHKKRIEQIMETLAF